MAFGTPTLSEADVLMQPFYDQQIKAMLVNWMKKITTNQIKKLLVMAGNEMTMLGYDDVI